MSRVYYFGRACFSCHGREREREGEASGRRPQSRSSLSGSSSWPWLEMAEFYNLCSVVAGPGCSKPVNGPTG